MALSDLKSPGKYGGNVHSILRRFLASNIGKEWDKLYSRICAVAPSNTYLGNQVRQAVEWMVDTKPALYANDYFVDASGKLQKSPNQSWKTGWKKRKETIPISKIAFTQDNNEWFEFTNLWYEYVSVSTRWSRRPIKGFHREPIQRYYWEKDDPFMSYPYYSDHKEWFEFTRILTDRIVPVYEYIHNDQFGPSPQRRQVGTRVVVDEEIHKRQCNSKEVKHLRLIAARQSKAKMTIHSTRTRGGDRNQWTAVISSRKGF